MFKKILTGIAYVAMVIVNFLAVSLPLNNRSTGQISDAYPNLFTPAGLTFSIWGLIYLLLAGYVLYQFINKDKKLEVLFKKINPLFIMTCLANIAWIFSWHYDLIGLSVLIMAILLFLLIRIADILGTEKRLFVSTPFMVYFGWITVATIANITVFLVSIGWDRFGLSDLIWTIIVLLIGALIGILRMRKDQSPAYGMVLIWAYLGILFKHLSAGGWDGKYPAIIVTVILCLFLFGFFVGKMFYRK